MDRPPNSKLLKAKRTEEKIFSYIFHLITYPYNSAITLRSFTDDDSKKIHSGLLEPQVKATRPCDLLQIVFQPKFPSPEKQKTRAESAITLYLNKSNRSPTIKTFPVFFTHQLLSS